MHNEIDYFIEKRKQKCKTTSLFYITDKKTKVSNAFPYNSVTRHLIYILLVYFKGRQINLQKPRLEKSIFYILHLQPAKIKISVCFLKIRLNVCLSTSEVSPKYDPEGLLSNSSDVWIDFTLRWSHIFWKQFLTLRSLHRCMNLSKFEKIKKEIGKRIKWRYI